ncbi:MAG TPA: von Willebrand factor type A domain-containing protein [Ignavibacteriaceae bacterium]|nr:von Willebrand factor type A domain-containing protein [Ignavibacteriaceae bacterium]
MKLYTIIFAFLFTVSLSFPKTGIITGTVKDSLTGESLTGANVVLLHTSIGAATDLNGFFQIKNIPEGIYTLKVTYIGYESKNFENIKVEADKKINLEVKLKTAEIEGEMICVTAQALGQKESINQQLCSYSISGISGDFNTEEYAYISENNFKDAVKNPLSTFSIDVDAASYSNTRRFLMEGRLPPKDAVRVEEFINYFDYDYPQPTSDLPFKIYTEYSSCPWNEDNYLVHIGIKGKELSKNESIPSSLTFLIDVSGSMSPPNKLPLLKKAFKMLVGQLKKDDKIAIVVYAGAAGLVLPSTSGSEKAKILDAINQLEAGGSTAGGEGIMLAYKIAKENFIKNGNNRVILATDGDFNIGITNTGELVRFLDEKKKDGIFLTVLGFGEENIKDSRLEEFADKGNGNYSYIDNMLEAKKVFVDEMGATLFTIAKDVKIQVEFNPAKIKSYRLVGYENRLLNDEDFENDKKDAGEIGAGHTVTALYEIVPLENAEALPEDFKLKYQEKIIKKSASETEEILTVSIRYKKPDEDTSKLISAVISGKPVSLQKSSDNFKFSAAVAQFGMLLRDSEFKGNADFEKTRELAKNSLGEDKYGYRAEFLRLVDLASGLTSQ